MDASFKIDVQTHFPVNFRKEDKFYFKRVQQQLHTYNNLHIHCILYRLSPSEKAFDLEKIKLCIPKPGIWRKRKKGRRWIVTENDYKKLLFPANKQKLISQLIRLGHRRSSSQKGHSHMPLHISSGGRQAKLLSQRRNPECASQICEPLQKISSRARPYHKNKANKEIN